MREQRYYTIPAARMVWKHWIKHTLLTMITLAVLGLSAHFVAQAGSETAVRVPAQVAVSAAPRSLLASCQPCQDEVQAARLSEQRRADSAAATILKSIARTYDAALPLCAMPR